MRRGKSCKLGGYLGKQPLQIRVGWQMSMSFQSVLCRAVVQMFRTQAMASPA